MNSSTFDTSPIAVLLLNRGRLSTFLLPSSFPIHLAVIGPFRSGKRFAR
jgi:hypothetical protein